MSSTGTSERIHALLLQADEAIRINELQKAAVALREATRLDSADTQVKERWTALQKLDDGSDALELLRVYLASQETEDGQKALKALKAKQLPTEEAVQAAELVFRVKSTSELLDSLTAEVLLRNVTARKVAATKLSENATEVFELLCERGEHSFNALAAIPLENSLWQSKEQQVTAQKDVFRLCAATLIEAGAEHLERVLRCIARILTIAPDNVADLVDGEVLDAILSFLDVRVLPPLRSQAMLATSKLLEATKQRGEELFSEFITGRASKQTNDDLIIVFSAAAAVFPITTAVAAKLFLTDGFVQQLVPNLERNWDDGAAERRYVDFP